MGGQQLFPAYAGVIPIILALAIINQAFPRIRGGDPRNANNANHRDIFSPHTRG